MKNILLYLIKEKCDIQRIILLLLTCKFAFISSADAMASIHQGIFLPISLAEYKEQAQWQDNRGTKNFYKDISPNSNISNASSSDDALRLISEQLEIRNTISQSTKNNRQFLLNSSAENKLIEKNETSSKLEGAIVPLPKPFEIEEINNKTISNGLIRKSNQPKHLSAQYNQPISMSFLGADINVVLQNFSQLTGLNIVATESVKGKVTMELKKVPWRQAFQTLLDAHGLNMHEKNNVIWVATIEELAKRAQQNYEAHARHGELEPLASRVIKMRYQQADVAYRLIAEGTQRLLSKRGVATADTRSNQIFITDLPARLDQIEFMLNQIDQPMRQVLIEARIVEAENGFGRQLGFRLNAGRHQQATWQSEKSIKLNNGLTLDLPALGIDGLAPATGALTLFRSGAGQLLSLELNALEADKRGKVLSSPKVITGDRTKAVIEQGTELPYQTKIRSGVSGLQFRKAVLRLEVTPHIMPDFRVSLAVNVAKDSVGKQTESGLAINTKFVSTLVEIENGGTVAIGGIYQQDQRNDVERVPLLSDIPLFGNLFKRSSRSELKSELIIFLTPTVVDTNGQALANQTTFLQN